MTSSAQTLIDTAPLGALVAYSDGRPRPPARFKRKLSDWRRFNGVGRLDSVTPADVVGRHEVPGRFMLHVGDFGSFGTIVLTMRLCFDARSPLAFDAIDPKPGAVVGFLSDGVRLELGGVFADMGAASAWLAEPHADRAFIAEVRPDRTLRRLAPALTAIAA